MSPENNSNTNPLDTTEEVMTETTNGNGNGQIEQKLLDLEDLTKGMEIKREFQFSVNTIAGEVVVPVKITSWADNPDGINGVVVGTPSEWAQPISAYYEAKSALGAVSSLPNHELVDPEGLIMYKSFEAYERAYTGNLFGWAAMGYAGEVDVPAFFPRANGKDPETFTSAWGELVKNNNTKEIGFVAVNTPKGGTGGKHYRDIDDWKRAQNVYAKCQSTMRIFNEGGVNIFLGERLAKKYAKYFLLLWNLREVDPAAAQQVSRQNYRLRITKNGMRKASQKEYSKLVKAEKEGTPIAPITEIGGKTLVEGQVYSITNFHGVALSSITFSLHDKNTQAILTANKDRIENGRRKLVEVGF